MFGSKILDVAIGIVFLFVLVSVICSAIREAIEAKLKTRAAYLERGIRELLHDKPAKGLAKSFYNHPLIYGIFSGDYSPEEYSERPKLFVSGSNLPSYIPSKNFALALLDMVARGTDCEAENYDPDADVISIENIRKNASNLHDARVRRVLLTAIDSAQRDLNKVQANLEAWYDSAMDRVSGQYKRSTHWILFWIALSVAVGLNVNTIAIADYLYRNDSVRDGMVARAKEAAKDYSDDSKNYKNARQELEAVNLPIGWTEGWRATKSGDPWSADWWGRLAAQVFGWLLTAFAATLGAPFWFDVLNKVMVIRSTVKPHEKSPEEASEDRQISTTRTAEPSGVGSASAAGVSGGGADGATPAGSTPRQETEPPSLVDDENSVDGCEIHPLDENVTMDVDLPAAEGGVA